MYIKEALARMHDRELCPPAVVLRPVCSHVVELSFEGQVVTAMHIGIGPWK